MNRLFAAIISLLVCIWSFAATAGSDIFVNGKELSDAELDLAATSCGVAIESARLTEAQQTTLQRIYGSKVRANRFWYDAVSGAWRYEGMPATGQIAAGLSLGGRLQPDASTASSMVSVNVAIFISQRSPIFSANLAP